MGLADMKTWATLAAIIVIAASVHSTAHAQTISDPAAASVFEQIGADLMGGLEAQGALDAWRAKLMGGGAIAIWPMAADDAPVPKAVLEAWNNNLTDSLLRSAQGRYRFVTRADLGALVREAQHAEVIEETGNPVAAVLKGGKADYVVTGRARVADNGIAVSYRLIEVKTNSARAASREYVVPMDFSRLSAQQDSLALEAATTDAAKYFAGQIPDLQTLRNRGIRQADSGVETPLGRYLSTRMLDAIQEKASNSLAERRLRVVDAALDDSAVTAVKSRGAWDKGISSELTGSESGSYVFEGTYWQVGQFVELRLAAANAKGERYAWTKRIFTASLRPDLIEAAGSPWSKGAGDEWAKNSGTGPIGLDLNSNKGKNPSYRVGETMVLLLKLGEDAYVDCFYRQVDGQTMKIFPNRYLPNGKLSAKTVASIPGEGMPFDFLVQEPQGVDRVKCFAADRNLAADLPKEIGAQDLTALPPAMANRLSDLYRAVPKAKISEATMVVTVHK
jgi:Domain of unknown function (DUF4384)